MTPSKTYHFIGIGGAGMSPIAEILLLKGEPVSGSDLKETPITRFLESQGAKISYGHSKKAIVNTKQIVVSSAISQKNPEIKEAIAQNIPIMKRAEMLAQLMAPFPKRMAVAGTHGKTTTTGMLAAIFELANQSPTFLVGSECIHSGKRAQLGKSDTFITESDESDGSFLLLSPNSGVITNIEKEHMNYFKTKANLMDHFREFMTKIVGEGGHLVLNKDDLNTQQLLTPEISKNAIFFGFDETAELSATDLRHTPDGSIFQLNVKGKGCGEVHLKVHGAHNIYNALAAMALALKEDLPLGKIIEGIQSFQGTKRRLQKISTHQGIRVYDDYAHHPTEIQHTLLTVKLSFPGRVICVFQPHRYSRTQNLMKEFFAAFDSADKLIISDIYSAGEDPIEGVKPEKLVAEINKRNVSAEHVGSNEAILDHLIKTTEPGDIVVTMGAGDISQVAHGLAKHLETSH